MAETRALRFASGTLIAERYEVVRQLGKGSIGEVVHVLDRHLDYQSLALKILHPHLLRDESIQIRFQNEVVISRQLAHENIIRTFDITIDAQLQYLSMEYISGCNLSEIAASYERRRMPLGETVYILQQVSEALRYAHQKKIIHRDIKPHNILLDAEGVVKLTDFGLARSLESSHGLTRTGEILGSPGYLAPEQFRCIPPTISADLYAFGILGFELLTGKLPFEGESLLALAMSHQDTPFPTEVLLDRGAPDWLVELLNACCQKDPEKRPTAACVAEEILAHRTTAILQPQMLLRTAVRKKNEDSRILNKAARLLVIVVWGVVVLTGFGFAIFEPGSQGRAFQFLVRMEIESGLTSKKLQKFFIGINCDPLRPEELVRIATHGTASQVAILLDSGHSTTTRFHDETRDTVLHRVIRNDAKHAMIVAHKAFDFRNRNSAGETPLLLAIKRASTVVSRHLLSDFYPVNIPDKKGNYPLLVAISTGQLEFLEMLFNFTNQIDQVYQGHARKRGYTPSWFSPEPFTYDDVIAVRDRAQQYQIFQSVRDAQGLGALHLAVVAEKTAILGLLLRKGLDVEMRDTAGRTALMHLMQLSPSESNKRMFHLLLSYRAKLTSRDDANLTVLEHAQLAGHQEWIALLAGHTAESTSNSSDSARLSTQSANSSMEML